MELRIIKIKELLNFIDSDIYKNSIHVPITYQRAISQFKNPRADKNDVALIIALNRQNQIIGYIGALPEKLPDKSSIKTAWNSCWWVDASKGKFVAIPLFLKMLSCYNSNLMFRDLSPKTKKIILRLKIFEVVKPLNGYKYFLKLDSKTILPKKRKIFKHFQALLKIIDVITNKMFRLIQLKFKDLSKCYKVNYIQFIDDESEYFIKKHQRNELFKRGKKDLDWIKKNPWVKVGDKNELDKRYFFTSKSSSFKNEIVKIYDKMNNLIGVFFISENNGLIKFPYAYFDNSHKKIIGSFISDYLIEQKATYFETFNSKIIELLNKRNSVFLFKKKLEAEFVVSKKLVGFLPENFDFQDGEGDFIFT